MLQVFLEMTHASRACNLDGMDLKKRIEELLAAKKANMSDLAAFCGVTPQAVQQWVSMGRMPRPERLKRIAAFFGISESALFNSSSAKTTTEIESDDFPTPTADEYEIIPQLDLEASCGHGKFNDYVVVKGGLSFKRETLQAWGITPTNGRIIYASGQSMEPTIGHGRVVLINMDERTPQDGRVYLICDGDSAMLLKRLVREFDAATGGMVWKMRSDNSDKRQYADKPLPDHSTATIVGRAVWHDGIL